MTEEQMMDAHEAAEYLRVSKPTLTRWRLAGKGPAFSRLGTKIVYRRSDLDAFVEANRVTTQ